MTADRADAYGRVMRTLAELGPAKLQGFEQDAIRDAADARVFADDDSAPAVVAMVEVRELAARLIESDRWLVEAAMRLVEDVEACGPREVVADVAERQLVTQVA
jgi:hypothetical protein